jgi:hypothetical protein
MRNPIALKTNVLFLTVLLAAMPAAWAADCGNTTMPAGAKPSPRSELEKAFSGKTWDWGPKYGASFWSGDGRFVAYAEVEKAIGKGTWHVTDDGKVCYDATWTSSTGSGQHAQCWAHVKTPNGREYNAVDDGPDKGKWWCSEASRKGVFGNLKQGDLVTPQLVAFAAKNKIEMSK